jgi:ABC-2 type transport system ATP-binding protein
MDTPDGLRAGLFGRGVEVRLTSEASNFVSTAKTLSFVKNVMASNGILSVELDDPDEQSPALIQALIAAGAQIRSVQPTSHSLEDVYMRLVGSKNTEEN